MATKNTRQVTNLNLTPELPQVTSRDFNLFYTPQKEPDIAGLKELTTALDSFINGAGAKAEIAGEMQQKQVNSAQAELDYNTNKKAFADKVKAGEIPLQANPYYIEKYKDLTLKSYASEFSTLLSAEYSDKGIAKYPDPTTFDNFYTDTLKKFVTDKGLSSFNPIELEKSFFQETSKFRNQLENINRQSQIEKFKENFDIKMNKVILTSIDKHKNFGNSPVDDPNVDKFQLIGNEINNQLSDLKSFGANGKDLNILTRDALKAYVTNVRPEDYKFAKQLIMQLPQYLAGGTDTFDKTSSAKALQDELMTLLNEKSQHKVSVDNALTKGQQERVKLTTYNYIEDEFQKNPNFDVNAWKLDKNRSTAERQGAEDWIKDQFFDGGKTDNLDLLNKVELLGLEGKTQEASDLLRKGLENKQIKGETFRIFMKEHIPHYQEGAGNYALTNRLVRTDLNSIEKIIIDPKDPSSVEEAKNAKIYLTDKITKWYSSNKDSFKGKSSSEINDAIEAQWNKYYKDLKSTDRYPKLFGTLADNSFRFGSGKNMVDNMDNYIEVQKQQKELEQQNQQKIKNKNVQNQSAQSMYDNKVKPKYSSTKQKTNTRMFND